MNERLAGMVNDYIEDVIYWHGMGEYTSGHEDNLRFIANVEALLPKMARASVSLSHHNRAYASVGADLGSDGLIADRTSDGAHVSMVYSQRAYVGPCWAEFINQILTEMDGV